jgi:LysR family transcriptional regulator, hydrogen peroxide-inducible genes activator
MTLAELRYLVAAADLRHFSRAAERCRISQPTFSIQVRKLEEFLGVHLFERTAKAVVTTPIGERIVAHARRILEEADQICELARRDQGMLRSTLRLGIIPTLGPYLLPQFLQELHQAFPDLRLILREDLTGNLLGALDAYELDALLLALPERIPSSPAMALFDEPFHLVCPTGHPLVERRAVTEDDLAKHRLLLLDEGHCLREQALAVCGDHFRDREQLPDDFRATSLETICEMVAAGLGCTLLPALAIPHLTARNPRLEVRALEVANSSRRIGLLWRQSFPRHADLVALGGFIQDRLPPSVRLVARLPNALQNRSLATSERRKRRKVPVTS